MLMKSSRDDSRHAVQRPDAGRSRARTLRPSDTEAMSLAHANQLLRSAERHPLAGILTAYLNEIVVNGARIEVGRPEAVHQVRVAGRRLQAALRMFREAEPEQTDRLRKKVNWLIDQLAPAREIDTFIDEVLKPAMIRQDAPAFVQWAYRRSLAIRRKAYHQVHLAFSSREYGRLVDDVKKFSTSREVSLLDGGRAEIISARFLTKMRRKLKLKKISNLNNAKLHKLRLRAKRMRYGVEIATLILAGKTASVDLQKLLGALSKLQSTLGAVNDMVVFKQRIRDFLQARGGGDEAFDKKQLRLLLPKPNKRRRALLKKASRAHAQVLRTECRL